MQMKFNVVLESSDEGYAVTVPALSGCISEGNTLDESLQNIREAVLQYPEPVDDLENLCSNYRGDNR
jgi:predicted RNase H-like HicB family nuclease